MLCGECFCDVVFDCVDEFKIELLRCYVGEGQRRLNGSDKIPDGMEEMGLSKADASVDQEGVEPGLARGFGNGHRRASSEFISRPNDKGVKSEPGVEAGAGSGQGGSGGSGGKIVF